MPRFLPILLALALGAQPVGEAFFYLWYFLDNASFEQAFCENLDKPQLQCHGKCHLTEIAEAPAPMPERISAEFGETKTPAFTLLDIQVSYQITPYLQVRAGYRTSSTPPTTSTSTAR